MDKKGEPLSEWNDHSTDRPSELSKAVFEIEDSPGTIFTVYHDGKPLVSVDLSGAHNIPVRNRIRSAIKKENRIC